MASRKVCWENEKELLDPKFNRQTDVIKINTTNTLSHELAKFFLCWEAAKNEKTFVTEAIFLNGKRADILILDTPEAWEVLHTESLERFNKKKKDYPVEVLGFKSKEVIDYWLKKLTESQ